MEARVSRPKELLALDEIEELARMALDEYGLTARGWKFKWDRAVRRAGYCDYRNKTISISQPIYSIPTNNDDAVDTILHEIAHAVAGNAAGHGPEWKRVAASIGATPERCGSYEQPPTSYVGTCGCGRSFGRFRLPSARYRHYCRTCRGQITWRRR